MSYSCGVAIVVSPEVAAEAIRLASRAIMLSGDPVFWLGSGLVPHITLYQGKFPDREKALHAWERLGGVLSPSLLALDDSLEVRPNGNVFWNVCPNDALRAVHMKVAQEMQLRSDGLLTDQTMREFRASDRDVSECDRILAFGSLASGIAYYPHITLLRLPKEADRSRIVDLRPQRLSFVPERLCFGPIDEYGQMRPSELLYRSL
jgi:hypothetical protein